MERDLFIRAFDKKNVEDIVMGGVDKTVSRASLTAFKDPAWRANLIRKIAEGRYKIAPPRVCRIPKDDGSYREIFVNTDIDRLLLALANRAYIQLYGDQLSNACKAYLPGSSTSRAVKELVQNKWDFGFKIDLSKYFDSVPKEVLYQCLDELDTGSPLDKIIADYYKDDTVIIDGVETKRYKALAQGCAVSTFLANYVLRHIDMEMEKEYSYYARYSDDIVIFGGVLSPFVVELEKIGLSINIRKLEVLNPSKEFTFLGYGIRGNDILVSQKHFAEIKKRVKHACKTAKKKDLPTLIKCVQNVLLYKQEPFYSWIYKQSCVTDLNRFVQLDNYCKDCIRATLTGSWNYTHNVHLYDNEAFLSAGWQPVTHLVNLAKMSRALFYEEVKNI